MTAHPSEKWLPEGSGLSNPAPWWFWVAWPLVSLASIVAAIGWPMQEAALLPLLLGGLWLIGRHGSPSVRRVVNALIIGTSASVLLLYLQTAQVSYLGGLDAVQFGWPVNWLTQDQTWTDPMSYPSEQGVGAIGETPASVNYLLWLVDIALLSAAAWVLLLVRHRLRGPEAKHGQPSPSASVSTS